MITPFKYDLVLRRGITFPQLPIRWKDEGDNPIDLTGYAFFAQVRRRPDSEIILIDLKPVIIAPLDGRMMLSEINPTDTQALKEGCFYWDLVVMNPEGQRIGPWLTGDFDIQSINTHNS